MAIVMQDLWGQHLLCHATLAGHCLTLCPQPDVHATEELHCGPSHSGRPLGLWHTCASPILCCLLLRALSQHCDTAGTNNWSYFLLYYKVLKIVNLFEKV